MIAGSPFITAPRQENPESLAPRENAAQPRAAAVPRRGPADGEADPGVVSRGAGRPARTSSARRALAGRPLLLPEHLRDGLVAAAARRPCSRRTRHVADVLRALLRCRRDRAVAHVMADADDHRPFS